MVPWPTGRNVSYARRRSGRDPEVWNRGFVNFRYVSTCDFMTEWVRPKEVGGKYFDTPIWLWRPR